MNRFDLCFLGSEPFEFERLIVSDDESIDDDDDPTLLNIDNDRHHRVRNQTIGQLPRALSLCLLNHIQIGQLYCADSSIPVTRYSIPQQAYRHVTDIPFTRIPTNYSTNFTPKRSISNNIEHLFDGLSTLDGQNFDQMQETELNSSSNG